MKPATRQQYGAFNYSEGGAVDRFDGWEMALREGASDFNVGKVYDTPPARGGVLAGDNGILFHDGPYLGVLRATLAPSGITPGQTYLSQNAATPHAYQGDTPLDMQQQIQRPAPWRKGV